MKSDEFLFELFKPESSFELEWDDSFGPKEMHATAYDRQGRTINISFVPVRNNIVEIEFSRGGSTDVTGKGDTGFVFATVLEAVRQYLKNHQPKAIIFSASKGETGSRPKLYQSLINRFANDFGYEQQDINRFSQQALDPIRRSNTDVFLLKKKSTVDEINNGYRWNGDDYYRHLDEISRRGFLGGLGAAMAGISSMDTPKQNEPEQTTGTGLRKPEVDTSPTYNLLSKNTDTELTLHKAARQSGLKGPELAQFLGQMKHETWDFNRLKEKPVGKNYFARKYDIKYNPRKAKVLGNKYPGDGERYHGRGYIQLTGRHNYEQAGKALGIDLLNNPDLASDPDLAAKIAVWYWNTRVKPYVKNFADTKSVTYKINPGLLGLDKRHENFKNYLSLLQV